MTTLKADRARGRDTMAHDQNGTGPLLRTGSLRDFCMLGISGTSLFSTALQMRSTIRRQIGDDVASLMAIPQIRADGVTIDWYAPSGSRVIPWSAATLQEQKAVLPRLQSARHCVSSHAGLLADRPAMSRDFELFARLLPFALFIPDETHIYLVDGQPVVTFWGFSPLAVPGGIDVLTGLSLSSAQTPISPVQIAQPSGWPWWLWFLLAVPLVLLFLLLLIWFMRWWALSLPEEKRGLLPSWLSGPLLEDQHSIIPFLPFRQAVVVDGASGKAVALDSGQGDMTAPSPSGGTEQLVEPDKGQSDSPPESSPADRADETDKSGSSPEEGSSPPPVSPDEASSAAEALHIPPEALQSGQTDFLNGTWRSHTGLVDGATSLPLDVEYSFDKGAGTMTIRRGDGVVCTGPGNARMDQGRLHIDQAESVRCPDGREFAPSQVVCDRDTNGKARCQGVNPDGARYHVDIGRQSGH
ncbi:hypothetical protein HEQ60_06025 [Haematospirillum sp. H1815]|uniref:SrfA family protein n=1 Tax=Haematospirillum sp. H1815 TaxID=2723108 RepID=UPI00143AF02D|nr:SrfA family protein [Haematospirillum sp. H1815]NKD77317.1 hypothetical protein [Haematospirillum sp. H1815]